MNRAHTSVHRVRDLQIPDRRTPMKVLVKMFVFVELVWSAYADDNKPDIRRVVYHTLHTLVVRTLFIHRT